MSNATLTTSTNFNGIEIDIRIEDDSLQAALAQLEALDGKTKPATKKKAAPKKQKEEAPAVDPTPAQEPQVQEEAPTATESAPQTSSEADTAPQTDATSSATATAEPSNPEPAVEAPAEAPAKEAPAKEVTGEDVLASAKKLLSSGPDGEPTLKACLAEVGAQTVGTCPAEKRGDLKAAIDAKLEA